MKKTILVIIFILTAFSVYAIVNTWQGDISHAWSTPTNWALNHVPTISEDVYIPDVGDYPYISATGGYTAYCNSISIASDARLRIANGTLNVTNDMTIYGEVWMSSADAVINVDDDIIWYSGSTEIISYGIIQVAGDWTFEDGCNVTIEPDNTVVFDGSSSQFLYVYDSNSYFANLTVDQTGTSAMWLESSITCDIQVTGDLTLTNNSILQVQTTTLTVDGILDIENGSKMYLAHFGGDLINNSDFTLNGEMDIDGGDALIHGEFDLETTGILTIDGGSFMYDEGVGGVPTNIRGIINQSDGLLQAPEKLSFDSSSSTTITGGIIRASGISAYYAGTFQPSGGTVEIQTDSGTHGSISCYNGNYFRNLSITPTSGGGCIINTDITVQNNLEISAGSLWFNSYEATVNNDVNIYGGLKMNNSSDVLNVGDNITWFNGSFDDITDGTINISGNWTFENGTYAQFTGANTVNFVGSTSQFIYCMDSNAQFNKVVIDQTGSIATWLAGSSTEDIHIAGNLTINAANDLQVGTEILTVDGVLDVESTATLHLEHAGGSLVNNSDLSLNGEMDINGGEALIHGEFELASTGILTIDSGTFISDAANSRSWQEIFGTFNLSSGLFEITNNSLLISSTCIDNITGGTIRVGGSFNAISPGTFQPSGGSFIRINADFGSLSCTNGNYFHDLIIEDGTPAATDITINGSLTVNSDDFSVGASTVDVANDVYVYSELQLSNPSAILNIGNNIIWYSGSTDYISNGTINVSGNWTFENGTNAQLGAGNTVVFNTGVAGIQNQDSNAEFGNVVINEYLYIDGVNTHSTKITGDLTVNPGYTLNIQDRALEVDGTINIANTGSIICYTSTYGGSIINNSDFTLNGELDVGPGDVLIHGEFDIGTNGEVTIDGGSLIYDEGIGQNGISGTLNISDGLYSAHEAIFIPNGATTNITGGIIRSRVGLNAQFAGTFQPTGGVFEVLYDLVGWGTTTCNNGNFFHDFKVETLDGGVSFNSDILVQNDLEITSGHIYLYGTEVTVNNDVNIYGGIRMDNSLDVLNVGNNLTWFSGSFDEFLTEGTINVSGDWYFNDGIDVQLGTGNTVNFVGSTTQLIYCYDEDASFGNLEVDKIGVYPLWLDNSNTYDIQVTGNLTVAAGSKLQVQTTTLTVDGTLDIENTGKMYLEHTGGQLVNNSDFDLDGEMIIDGGDAMIHGTFAINSTGLLSIASGSFEYDGGGSENRISGTLNITGGTYQSDRTISIYPTGIMNMTGGTIKSRVGFSAQNPGNFQPTGGVVEFNRSSAGGGVVTCNNGNYFYDLHVTSSHPSGGIGLNSDILVQNNLEIIGGGVNLSEQKAEVQNNVEIYGDLIMLDPSDELDVGNDITFHSGSQLTVFSEISEGVIELAGDWYFNNGIDAQFGTGNTVNFVGSENSYIYCDDANACFGNLIIDKDSSIDMVEVSSNNIIRTAGDLTVTEGMLKIHDQSTLEIGNEFNIYSSFYTQGTSSNDAVISKYETGFFDINVETGGMIGGSYTTFENVGSAGVNIKAGAFLDALYSLNNCTFQNGEAGGSLLTIDNSQTVTIDGAEFNAGSRDATYNVTKTVDAGEITFTNSSGLFDGPDYEDDIHDRIHWVGFTAPTVTTAAITEIEQTTATSGGNVTADGGSSVTSRGVCWSISPDPTIADDHTADSSGTGAFVSSLIGLDPGTLYYVRAYAVNAVGASYGSGVTFTTTAATPLVTVSVTSLPDFGELPIDTNSSEQSYTVSGSDLTGDITINAPAGFAISTMSEARVSSRNSRDFVSEIVLLSSGGSVSDTTIYVRFQPTIADVYSGNITHESSGAVTKNVAVSGTGIDSDLEITNVVWSTTDPYICDEVSIDVTISNNGSAPSTECYLELYYDLDSPPASGGSGDRHILVSSISAGDSDVISITQVWNDISEEWSSYLQIDVDNTVSESNETNNIWGADTVTWNSLPTINDLTIEVISDNIELSWTYPINCDFYIIYRSTDPNDFSGAVAETSVTESYSEAVSGTKYFYKVMAVRNCEVPTFAGDTESYGKIEDDINIEK